MLDSEETIQRLSEERSDIALKLQRKQRLEAMVNKRKANLAYLQVSEFRLYLIMHIE
jgi:hypothetical protein